MPFGNRASRAFATSSSHMSSGFFCRLASSSATSFFPAATNRLCARKWIASGPAGVASPPPATGKNGASPFAARAAAWPLTKPSR